MHLKYNERGNSVKKSIAHIFVVGFALFSMLFGAGNVIFPPYLGLSCGAQWVQGFLYYFLADIGLAMGCLFAIQHSGSPQAIVGHMGKIPSHIMGCMIVICIGPMLGIPRTAASTFEMSILPLFPQGNSVLFSFLFFGIVALLCLKESSVIDIIGKILTPLLLVGLLVLIVQGVLHPIGPIPDRVLVDNVPVTGIRAGYQTMDVLAVVIFGVLISKSVKGKGYETPQQQKHIIYGAVMVAGISLFAIYLGLSYLGVTASALFDLRVDHTYLITTIVHRLLGQSGTVIFSIVVALACLTTAVALVSACSGYFSFLSSRKIHYTWLVVIMCAFSAVVTTFGLNQIIAIAAPILDVVYPPTVFLILASFFERWIPNDWVFRFGAAGACVVSVMGLLYKCGLPFDFLHMLPLDSYGFGWLLPALVCSAVGFLLPGKK